MHAPAASSGQNRIPAQTRNGTQRKSGVSTLSVKTPAGPKLTTLTMLSPTRAPRNGAGSDDRTDKCRQSAGQNGKAQNILGSRKGVGSSGKTVDQVASEQCLPSIARSHAQGTQQRLGR